MENIGQAKLTVKEGDIYEIEIDWSRFVRIEKVNTSALFLIRIIYKGENRKEYYEFIPFKKGKERNDFITCLNKAIKKKKDASRN